MGTEGRFSQALEDPSMGFCNGTVSSQDNTDTVLLAISLNMIDTRTIAVWQLSRGRAHQSQASLPNGQDLFRSHSSSPYLVYDQGAACSLRWYMTVL